MYWAGHGIEKIIGKVQKAKVSVATRPGVQPILSLESQLALDKIQDLIAFAIERFYLPMIPHLEGKSCLEIGAGKPVFATHFLQKQAKAMITVNTGYGESPIQGDASRGFIVKAETHNLPFEDDSFDFIFNPVSNCFIPEIQPVWEETFRVLRKGGTMAVGFTNPIEYCFDIKLADKEIYHRWFQTFSATRLLKTSLGL